jgi:glyoxylase-like metal-dependent hydrolase (beta-lactamase superfamily II)
MTEDELPAVLDRLGARLLVRGWLSANNIVFAGPLSETTAVVDTGYFSHAEQTCQLLATALADRTLDYIVNTHLHSDHCGGNRLLQEQHAGASLTVPAGYRDAVDPWLGSRAWEVHAAPGHDPEAVMLYEPQERVLISGDALWERRLAIIFPELSGGAGFAATHCTLDAIERLDPRWVLPGHGGAFDDVAAALRRSRERLDLFAAQPGRHREHAARALAMFRMLELQSASRLELEAWMVRTPIFGRALGVERHAPVSSPLPEPGPSERLASDKSHELESAAQEVVESRIRDGALYVSKGSNLTFDST